MMKLANDWTDIAKRAWSMRFMYLLAIFGAVEAALPFLIDGFEIPSKISGLLTLVITMAAMGARLIYQSGLSKPKEDPEQEPWI